MIEKATIGAQVQAYSGSPVERGARGAELGGAAQKSQGFGEFIKNGIDAVNHSVVDFEKTSQQFANGGKVNIHELMIKGEQATMGLQLMLSMRSKIVEAYQEVMRMPV